MGLFSMLSSFDPDEIVRKIESAEEKLESWIDSGDVVISKAQNVVDVVNGDTGSLDESVGSAVDGISDGFASKSE